MSLLQPDDLVFYKEGGKVMSAGYAVNNIFAEAGISPAPASRSRAEAARAGRMGVRFPTM